jgi:transposase
MPKKLYIVKLDPEERARIEQLTTQGRAPVRQLRRAQILRAAAEGLRDEDIARTLRVAHSTVERVRKRYVEEGLEPALVEKPRPGAKRKLEAKQEAFLIALACSDPPAGRTHWTMQLLADEMVALEQVEALSDETVRRTLKKTSSSPGRSAIGVSRRSARSS